MIQYGVTDRLRLCFFLSTVDCTEVTFLARRERCTVVLWCCISVTSSAGRIYSFKKVFSFIRGAYL